MGFETRMSDPNLRARRGITHVSFEQRPAQACLPAATIVLGRGLRDPPTSGLSLQMSAPRLKVHGLAYLLEEPLVQASRCLAHQPPTQTLTDVLV